MEIELTEHPTPPEKDPVVTSQRRFIKDEAVLARFGKRQQLRVGAPARASVLASLASEGLNWKAITLTLCFREVLGCYQSSA